MLRAAFRESRCNWCLIVETFAPFAGYDMAESGRIEMAPISGRISLEITFGSGRVRCDTWSGDLHLSSK
ncbi:hypothetical protein GCM10010372_04310 [Streptomyces tauricus]|nr:hypothetical protein GCM10010372_04310 [Streptomyces tauricus]